MDQNKYCAFISYRHKKPDMLVAKKLHSAIETYHVPRAIQKKFGKSRLGKVFRDAEELPLSSDLGADIEVALDNSEWFIAVCSPEYRKSIWCMRELEYFIEHHGLDHVLTVLVNGEPEDSFPEILCYGVNENGERVRIEPLASDVREKTISKCLRKINQEKLRLLAPMLSVSYDDLKRRARQRKLKMIMAAILAALAIVLGFGGILIASNRRAEALKQEAEEQKLQAAIERKNAVNKNIGELLEKASSYLMDNDRREAAALLLDAVTISEANENTRREEIVSLLRRTVYIAPFKPVSKLVDRNLQLRSIKITQDECFAIGIENGNTVVGIDLQTNMIRYRVLADSAKIDYLEFSSDGKRFLAICGNGQFVQVWNSEDGSSAYRYSSEKNTSLQIANAHFWKTTDTLLVQDWDTFFLFSEDGAKKEFYRMGNQQEGYSYESNLYTVFSDIHPLLAGRTSVKDYFSSTKEDYMYMDVILSNDMSKVLIAGVDGKTGTIILNEEGKRICLLYAMPGTVQEKYSFSPDGKQVSCISCNGFLAGWDTETGNLLYFTDAIEERALSIRNSRIAYSPGGDCLAYIYRDTLMMWDLVKNQYASLQFDEGERACDSCVSFTPDGKHIVAVYENAYFVDAKDLCPIETVIGDELVPYDECIVLNDTVLISQRSGGTLFYSLPSISSVSFIDPSEKDSFDVAKKTDPWKTVPKGKHRLSEDLKESYSQYFDDLSEALFYSNDGETAALSYPDGTIELFKREDNGEAYNEIKPFYYSALWKTALALSEHYLVTAGGAHQLVVYNLQNETIEKSFEADYYTRIVIDKGEQFFLATGPGNYGMYVFSLNTGELLFSMTNELLFTECGFSSDSTYAIGNTENGCIIADMLVDEFDVISRARRLVNGMNLN